MNNLLYATFEPNIHNLDGTAATMYFEGKPTEDEIYKAAKQASWPGNLTAMDDCGYWEAPNILTRKFNLTRIQMMAG